MHAYMHTCIHAYIQTDRHTYIPMHACIHAYRQTDRHTYPCMHTCIHACMHAYIHTCICLKTHRHTYSVYTHYSLSIYLSICLSVCLSVYRYIHLIISQIHIYVYGCLWLAFTHGFETFSSGLSGGPIWKLLIYCSRLSAKTIQKSSWSAGCRSGDWDWELSRWNQWIPWDFAADRWAEFPTLPMLCWNLCRRFRPSATAATLCLGRCRISNKKNQKFAYAQKIPSIYGFICNKFKKQVDWSGRLLIFAKVLQFMQV